MKIPLILSTLLTLFSCGFHEKQTNTELVLDFSGIETFVSLAKEAKLDTVTIDSLLLMEPYQKTKEWVMKRLNFREHDLKRLFFHAIFPTRYELVPKFNGGDFVLELSRVIIKNIQYVMNNPDTVLASIQAIKTQLNINSIIRQAQRFLPHKKVRKHYMAYFITGLGQGVAEEDYIVMDISKYTVKHISNLSDWFAHELFHLYRNEYAITHLKGRKYSGLDYVLSWLENEGIAELTQDNEVEGEKLAFCKEKLTQLNNSLKVALENDSQGGFDEITHTISNVQAHKVGHVMAFVIKEHLDPKELSKSVGNPLSFLNSYHRASKQADKSSIFVFDESVIDRVNSLEWIDEKEKGRE